MTTCGVAATCPGSVSEPTTGWHLVSSVRPTDSQLTNSPGWSAQVRLPSIDHRGRCTTSAEYRADLRICDAEY